MKENNFIIQNLLKFQNEKNVNGSDGLVIKNELKTQNQKILRMNMKDSFITKNQLKSQIKNKEVIIWQET